jgi:GH24 family phage-related lysozyme (muramidase)
MSNRITGEFPDLRDEDASSFGTGKTTSLTPYTATKFRADESVKQDWSVVREYMAGKVLDPASLDLMSEDADVLESFRDSESRFENMIAKAMVLEDAPEEIKESYKRIQSKFANVNNEGIGEWAGMIKDYGIDAVTDPFNIGAVWFAAQTGGVGAPAALAARETGKAVAKTALKKALTGPSAVARLPSKGVSTIVREVPTQESTLRTLRALMDKNPMKSVAAIGAAQGTIDDLAYQNLNITVGSQEDFNPLQTVATAGISAGLNVGMTVGIKKLTQKFKVDSDMDEFTPERGAELFDEGIEGEWIPASAASLIDDLPLLSGTTRNYENITPDEELIKKYAADLGGGAKTVEEVQAIIMAAAKTETTAGAIKNKIKKDLYAHATHGTSRWLGKASGVLSPFAKVSSTAKILQEKFSHEIGIDWKVNSRLVGKDFFETQREIQGRFFEDYRAIVEPLATSKFLRRNKDNAKLADEVNNALMLAVRGQKATSANGLTAEMNKAINKSSVGVKKLYKQMGSELKEAGLIENEVADYIPRSWNRKAIFENQKGLAKLFEDQGVVPKGKGMETVKDMLKIDNQLDSGGSGGFFFSAKRSFDNIKKDADFQEFLDTDVRASMNLYTFQAAKGLAKVRALGVRNEKEFKSFYIDRIRKEMAEAGETFTKKDAERITRVYRTTTSENLNRFGKYSQGAVDGYGLINRVAYLGLATVSSLTEVFLNVSKSGFRNSFKGLGEAMELSYKGATGNMQAKLMSQHGITAAEARAEMRKFSLGMDMGLTQLENRLGGDDLQTKWMQKASSGFFKMTLLEDWTKFVQTSSFMSGKNLIEENIQALVAHGAKPLGKRQNTLIGELAELDIDYKDAMKWYKNGAKRNEEFYDKTFLAGAARYANSVILQPSGMSNLKPLLFSNPKTSIAFQLMGYPAAFTNTVLKGSIKQITKDVRSGDPRNVGKVAVTALSMVQVARIMNDWRSDGKSEEKGTGDALFQAVKRVGGLGILADNITKSYDAAKYNQSVLGYGTLPFGPLATDALSVGRRGITPTLVRKIPAALSPVQKILGIVDEEAAEIFKADMDHFIYKADKSLSEFEQGFIPEFEADEGMLGFATGGIVKDVPNVPTEPDERIDKITGLPYNAQAGDAYIDIEDRAKFSMGGRILAKNLVGAVQKASRLVTKRQPELDPDGAILHGIEDDLLDLNKSIKANRPSRDYQNVPLASRNEKVTTSFLDENGYTDYSGTGKKDFTYELMEDGSYKVYTPYVDAKGKEKLGVKTFKDPTLKQLRTYMGYAEGGLVERLQKFEGGVAVEEPSSILDTVSKMASSAGVAILKHFDTAPNQEQLQQIEKVAKKIDAKTIEGVDQELMNEYKEGVIINALAVQGTPTTPNKKPKTYYGKNAISRVEEDEGELNSLQEYVVEHEGFVGGEYKDTKNIVTSGVGQTGKYKNMTFKEVFKIHQEEAKRYVPKFDSLSEKQQKALMSLVYRGDLQKSPTFRDRVNEGNFEQAAIELLDHKEYREYKRIAREGGNVSGIIGRLEEASEFIKG